MLRLLLLTLGTWSLLSLFLVGTFGSLLQLRQQERHRRREFAWSRSSDGNRLLRRAKTDAYGNWVKKVAQ